MSLTASNFIFSGPLSAADVDKFNAMLVYAEGSPGATALPNKFLSNPNQSIIFLNHENATGTKPNRSEIYWDPDKGFIVRDDNGVAIGQNSPALAFLHEVTHATDPNLSTKGSTPDLTYRFLGERVAVEAERPFERDLGETLRFNYKNTSADLVPVNSVTSHAA